MNNKRRRRNLMHRRIPNQTVQSNDISTTQENLVEQSTDLFQITDIRSLSEDTNLFEITDVRSLSEQNNDHDDLIPTNQELACDNNNISDYYPLLVNEFPGLNPAEDANKPKVLFHNYFPPNWLVLENWTQTSNNDIWFDFETGRFRKANGEYVTDKNATANIEEEIKPGSIVSIANNNTSANIKGTKSRSTEKNPVGVDDTNDEFISFEQRLTNHLRQLPLKSALLLQNEIQDLITVERLKCLEEQ